MEGKFQLSSGALSKICENAEDFEKPVLQVLTIEKSSASYTERYHITLSDGLNSISNSTLASQLSWMVREGRLSRFCIVRVDRFERTELIGKVDIVILKLEVLFYGREIKEQIGDPIKIDLDGNTPNVTRNAISAILERRDGKRSSEGRLTGNPFSKRQSIRESAICSGNNNNELDEKEKTIIPITSLSPYIKSWTIKARVTKKHDIKSFSNKRGSSQVFNVDMLDESGEIRIAFFGQLCEKFYPLIEQNNVYYISDCTLHEANKRYNKLDSNFELRFSEKSKLTFCKDQNANLTPQLSYKFVPINIISSLKKDMLIDVIGICRFVGDLIVFKNKTNGTDSKRKNLKIVDDTLMEVQITLWGATADSFKPVGNPVVAIKGCKVSDFNGVSLSASSSCMIRINPDFSRCFELKGWYDDEGHTKKFQSLCQDSKTQSQSASVMGTNIKLLQEIEKPNASSWNGDGTYCSVIATILHFNKEKALYQGCTRQGSDGRKCSKKVQNVGTSKYRCEKCNLELNSFRWILNLRFSLVDATGMQFVTCFQEMGEKILNISSQELGNLKNDNLNAYKKIFDDVEFKRFVFRLKTTLDKYNDTKRLQHTVLAADKIDYSMQNQKMKEELRGNNIKVI